MNDFLQSIETFAMGSTVWVYVFIFFGKILEVSFGTLRIVLINRGERTVGSLIAILEISLWLIVASSVLVGFKTDFVKGIVYALAFACGNYIGSWLDELLAFGLSSMQVVLPDMASAKEAEACLREKGFGITTLDVHGRDDDRSMLIMTMQRKRLPQAIAILEEHCNGAVVTVSDIKTQRGGYLERAVRSGQLRNGK
ncbi:MAG: DUF5698 domain-containing protein [Eubacteriales bacterium]|nr:DUF5698 domain-containing protein [Eubacteriales bacterium]